MTKMRPIVKVTVAAVIVTVLLGCAQARAQSVPSSGMFGKFLFLPGSMMAIAIPAARAAVRIPGGPPQVLVNDNLNNALNLPANSKAVFGNVLIKLPACVCGDAWPPGTLAMPIVGGIDQDARINYEAALEPGANGTANLRVQISNPDGGQRQDWLWLSITTLGSPYNGLMWSILADGTNTYQAAALTYNQQTGMTAGLIQPGLAVYPGTNAPVPTGINSPYIGRAFNIPWISQNAGRFVYYTNSRVVPVPSVTYNGVPTVGGFIYHVYDTSNANKLEFSFPEGTGLENLQFDPRQPDNLPAGSLPQTVLNLQVQAAGLNVMQAFFNNATNTFVPPPFITARIVTTQIQGYSGITPVTLSGGIGFLFTPGSGMTYLSNPQAIYPSNQSDYSPGVDFYTPDATTGQPQGDPNFGFSYVGGVPPGFQPYGFPGNP